MSNLDHWVPLDAVIGIVAEDRCSHLSSEEVVSWPVSEGVVVPRDALESVLADSNRGDEGCSCEDCTRRRAHRTTVFNALAGTGDTA